MWRVLRIIILPIYKNGEFCECCETYVSYVLMSKKTATGESMNLCLKTAAGEEENGLMFLCLKKDGGSYGKYV